MAPTQKRKQENNMKKTLWLFAFVSGLLTSMHAATKNGDQSATVVNVGIHHVHSDLSNPSSLDLPLQPEIYSYDIDIRVGSTVYRTRYDSALDYLPAAFTGNHPLQVNLKNHAMYVTLPGDRRARLIVEGRC
jgi:hypothetical protein